MPHIASRGKAPRPPAPSPPEVAPHPSRPFETRAERSLSAAAKLSWNCVLKRYSFERAFGTHDAQIARWRSPRCAAHTPTRRRHIRTLGVSLVAVAAIVASLTLAR